jgi:hypothetical protein
MSSNVDLSNVASALANVLNASGGGAASAPDAAPDATATDAEAAKPRCKSTALAAYQQREGTMSSGANTLVARPAAERRTLHCAGDFGVLTERPDGSFNDPAAAITPTYEWQLLPAGMLAPPELEVESPVDGGPSRVRIPRTWQLRVWLKFAQPPGYFSYEATRHSTIQQLREAAGEYARMPMEQLRIRLDDANPEDSKTVEQLRVFGRVSAMHVYVSSRESKFNQV